MNRLHKAMIWEYVGDIDETLRNILVAVNQFRKAKREGNEGLAEVHSVTLIELACHAAYIVNRWRTCGIDFIELQFGKDRPALERYILDAAKVWDGQPTSESKGKALLALKASAALI